MATGQQSLGSVAEENTSPNTGTSSSSVGQTSCIEVDTVKFGKVKVHVQGDLSEKDKKAVFLTVHDIGTNHSSIQDFVEQPCMSEIKARSIFIHLDLPGQEDNGDDLPDNISFPTIQQMEELIPTVLDHLKVNLVVGIGEGAGANVLVRFALANQSRVLGMVLIHLVTAGVGMLEKLKETFRSGKRRPSEAFTQPDQVIALHKFGAASGTLPPTAEEGILSDCKSRVANINSKNLRKYVEAYMNRKDISEKISEMKSLDILLVVGMRSPYMQGVINIHGRMDKSKTSLFKIDECVDPFHESPDKLAHSLLLFVKGLGYLTSLSLPGIDRQRTMSGESQSGDLSGNKAALGAIGRRRTLSMEEYDLPRPRRLSLTTGGGANSSPSK
ncbi:uncharacterized protein ZK1073.1 isoform X2 [Brevipalpus obovatus]|uniref:uncharacterized protein ZK1073.1 isoform X2 n=1 Tax=Brevipalpus obovatus TaxID=246614 RepID=UPI003D9E4F64